MTNKISSYLKQADNLDAIIKKVKRLTDQNHHTESYITISGQILKNKKLENAFRGVSLIEEFYGHLPHKLSEVRYEMYENMKHMLQSKLSTEDFQRVLM